MHREPKWNVAARDWGEKEGKLGCFMGTEVPFSHMKKVGGRLAEG